jgi:lysyl-tRNA synthetase class 2
MHVTSSAIIDIRYEAAETALYVTFVDGDRYRYAGVPAAVHSAFIAAESKGRFFAAEIRDRYPYRRVEP